jgi:hypothetical protein
MSDRIDEIDWAILDALQLPESVEQIQFSIQPIQLSQEQIIDRLERLHSEHYVYLLINTKFDRNLLIKEIKDTEDRKFWFDRTEKGFKTWQTCESIYANQDTSEPVGSAKPTPPGTSAAEQPRVPGSGAG